MPKLPPGSLSRLPAFLKLRLPAFLKLRLPAFLKLRLPAFLKLRLPLAGCGMRFGFKCRCSAGTENFPPCSLGCSIARA